jgi:hypothetical protein
MGLPITRLDLVVPSVGVVVVGGTPEGDFTLIQSSVAFSDPKSVLDSASFNYVLAEVVKKFCNDHFHWWADDMEAVPLRRRVIGKCCR